MHKASQKNEQKYLDDQGRLRQWPTKQKDQLLVLAYLATKFTYGTSYTEAEVNEVLKQWHTFGDWPLLRRELFDRNFLDRNPDGSHYRLQELPTYLPELTLVRPNIEQDATLAVGWLEGESGRETLRLMGNTDEHNKPSTIEDERQRLRDFVTATDQVTWMMRYQGKTVGAVWLRLDPTNYLPAPSIHIMIGDPSARGRGVGKAAVMALIEQLRQSGQHQWLHSRYLTDNLGSAKLLKNAGFIEDGKAYTDEDGLSFQNVKLTLNEQINDNRTTSNLADHFNFPNFQLARITDSDIDGTVALINKAYAYQDSYKQAARTNPVHLRKNATENEFYIVKQDNEIVGCVYTKGREDSIHFGLLTVADKFRGKGLGPALVEAVESYAKHCGAKKVELDYMSAAPWLKQYYERRGYAETGEVINWGTIDLIHMSKSLT